MMSSKVFVMVGLTPVIHDLVAAKEEKRGMPGQAWT
jgi:hypothetical protein